MCRAAYGGAGDSAESCWVWSETELNFVPSETYFKFRSSIGQKKRQGKRKPTNISKTTQRYNNFEEETKTKTCTATNEKI